MQVEVHDLHVSYYIMGFSTLALIVLRMGVTRGCLFRCRQLSAISFMVTAAGKCCSSGFTALIRFTQFLALTYTMRVKLGSMSFLQRGSKIN